jgi:hypothetical protein
MKMPVVLLSAWLAQTAGQAVNVTTLTLIAAFTEQAKATSSVLFFCWSPAGKTYRAFLFFVLLGKAAVTDVPADAGFYSTKLLCSGRQ